MAFRLKWKEGQHDHFHEAGSSNLDFVNTKLECLDFDNHASRMGIINEIRLGLPKVVAFESHRIFAYLMVGFLTGCFGGFIVLCYDYAAHHKYHLMVTVFKNKWGTSEQFVTYLMIVGCTLIPAMVGCALAVFIEPKAAGGGLVGVIAYVNGVKVPGALSCKTLIVKTFSLICCMVAGLAAGMEAPMIHVGACIACSMVNMRIPFTGIRPFDALHLDVERRDLVGSGIAAGIVGAFSTPIGGCLMALEEGLTFYNIGLLIRILLASITCCCTLNVILSLFSSCQGCLTQAHLLFFFVVKESTISHFYAAELPFYVTVGIVGGVLGSFWNLIQIRLIVLRKKYVSTKARQLTEMFLVALTTSTLYWILLASTQNICTQEAKFKEEMEVFNTIQLGCGKGSQFTVSSLFTFQAVPNIIRLLFSTTIERLPYVPLLIFVIEFYFLSVVTMGTIIAAGIFIPHLMIGAAWGRLFGEALRDVVGLNWIQPNKYAIIASGAQLCGAVRVPFTLGVLIMEASGSTVLGYPIFISVIVSYIVANFFTESIYHHQCGMAGIALVETDPPPFCSKITAQDLMSTPPVTFSRTVTVETVRNTLKSTTHNCFPVAAPNGALLGSVSRGLLIMLIKKGMFVGSSLEDFEERILAKEFLSKQNVQMIDETPGNQTLDLEPYMDATPFAVTKVTSFDSIYRLISCVGLRHILVIDSDYKIVGVITRKKLSAYRMHINAFHASVIKLPLR